MRPAGTAAWMSAAAAEATTHHGEVAAISGINVPLDAAPAFRDGRAVNRVLRSIATSLDAAIGLGGLPAGTRTQILTEQVRALIQMTPAMSMGSVIISFLLLRVTFGSPVFEAIVVWTIALYGMLLVGMRAWWRSVRGMEQRAASPRTVTRAVISAALMGVLWGFIPLLLFSAEIPASKLTTGVVLSGVLCASGFSLSILPPLAIAFTLPLFVMSFVAVAELDSPAQVQALTYLLITFALLMPVIGMRLARNFIEHLVSESRIRQQKDIIGLLLKEFEANSSDWLWEFNRNGRIERVSDRFAAAAALGAETLVGRDFRELLRSLSAEGDPALAEIESAVACRATFHDVALRVETGKGERWWRLTGKPTRDDLGDYAGYIGTASDITAERLAERRISFLAHNDALTGLANRAKFTEYLKQFVARLERYGSPFSVLFLDLDRFKAVNDSRGHLIGDKLLAEVGRRIRGALREADIAARLGGDEFAVILSNRCDAQDVGALASRLLRLVAQPYEIDGEIVTIGLSIGIAMAPADGTRADQILRNADLALYCAKEEGRGVHRFFEQRMDADARERRNLEADLKQALLEADFVLHYQPMISADDHRPCGFEALIRWNHPDRGLIMPAEFISVAEQTSLIREIGDWTIREACLAAARWPQDLPVSVNLSPRHFQLSDVAAVLREALEASGLPPHRLELEITEGLLLEEPDEVLAKLAAIKESGVMIAMDNFGTGYSSLSHLLRFPFDRIKIDRSLVMASSQDAAARDVLRSIASLGSTLNLRITAEGVETQEQADFLRQIACTQLQGFHFARPLNEAELASYFLGHFKQELGDAATAMHQASAVPGA